MTIFASYPSLANEVVLITGGASGIGEAHVEHFCAAGATVGFIDYNVEAGEALVARLAESNGRAPIFIQADLREIEIVQAAIAVFAKQHGDVGVLINNAAHDERHDIENVSVAYWDERIALNLRHLFFCAQAVIPGMIAKGSGSIVNVGSFSWRVGLGGLPIYMTAKAGIEGLTRGLARDLGPHNIRVNTLVPGWIMTKRQLDLWVTPEVELERQKRQCLKDKVMPADVARMALWLAAADSRMCTAQSFVVDGGWS